MVARGYENSVQAVGMAMALNTFLLIGMLVIYSLMLTSERFARILAPRLAARNRPTLRTALWGWPLKAWRARKRVYTDDLDGTVMIRFCVLGFKFSALGSVLACVLIPLYSTGHGDVTGFNDLHMANLEKGSENFWVVVVCAYLMAAFFIHLVAVEWRRFLELRKNHFLRLATGEHGAGAAQAQRSILVESVPDDRRAQDGKAVRRFFEESLFPDNGLHSCVLHPDTRLMHKDPAAILRGAGEVTRSQFRQALGLETPKSEVPNLSQLAFVAASAGGVVTASPCKKKELDAGPSQCQPNFSSPVATSGPSEGFSPSASHSGDSPSRCDREVPSEGYLGKASVWWRSSGRGFKKSPRTCCEQMVAPLRHFVREFFKLGRQLAHRTYQVVTFAQDISIGTAGSDTAFVTLCRLTDRIVAEQLVISHSGHWKARAAPEARDIIWKNAAIPLRQRHVRRLIANVGLICGLVFWSAPVGCLQVWSSLDDPVQLKNDTFWTRSTFGKLCYTFLRDYLPVLSLLVLQYALPYFIRFIAIEYEGCKVKSDVERWVLKWNFRYQLVTLYITVACGTLSMSWSQVGEVVSEPRTLFEILRSEVPQVSNYFVNYVIARVGITLPLLLFFPGLTHMWTSRKPSADADVAGGAGETQAPPAPLLVPVDFAMEASMLGLVLVLGLTYSVIAPAIMPICTVYFALAFVVYCWLFSFVYTPEFDCLGACFEVMMTSAMQGLLLGTLSLAALASAFVGFHSVAFYSLMVLSALVLFVIFYYGRIFAVPSRYTSLEDACLADKLCEDRLLGSFREDYYVDPLLKGLDSGNHMEPELSDWSEGNAAGGGDFATANVVALPVASPVARPGARSRAASMASIASFGGILDCLWPPCLLGAGSSGAGAPRAAPGSRAASRGSRPATGFDGIVLP